MTVTESTTGSYSLSDRLARLGQLTPAGPLQSPPAALIREPSRDNAAPGAAIDPEESQVSQPSGSREGFQYVPAVEVGGDVGAGSEARDVDPAALESRARLNTLKARVQRLLVEAVGADGEAVRGEQNAAHVRETIDRTVDQAVAESGVSQPRAERVRLAELVAAELLGFGPIQPLLDDETVSEVMVNGPQRVWVERKGLLEKTDVRFDDDEHVRRVIERIVAPLGRRCDESSPMVDARLPDGSRVNAIIPPLALNGPTLTIRKFSKQQLTVQKLIEYGSLTPEVATFLSAVVRGHTNILVSGGTGSGKTTLLNVLSSFIPSSERIVTIEDAAELRLSQEHVVSLEARPPNAEGAGAVPIRQLLVNALRMRPDRIVVGECRGGEALDMLQAMNTGHDGSMTTLHANSPRDAISRLETMVLMAGMDLPLRAIREQIASAVHLIVQQERMQGGSRQVTEVAEVQGMEGDIVTLEPIFRFVQTGFDGRRVSGRLEALGPRPKLLQRLERTGQSIPLDVFATRAPSV